MQSLIQAIVTITYGFGLFYGASYGADYLLVKVRSMALEKAHKGLGSMEEIAQNLTRRPR